MLFGTPIAWKANKQDTVTTSSTHAELLALSSAAKEQIAVARLLQEIELELDPGLTLLCDNIQTMATHRRRYPSAAAIKPENQKTSELANQ